MDGAAIYLFPFLLSYSFYSFLHIPKKPIMKKLQLSSILSLYMVSLCLLLAGCTDPEVKVVKNARHFDDMAPYGKILDDLADCGSTKWAAPTDDAGHKYVTATCFLSRGMTSDVRELALSQANKFLSEEVKRNKDYYVNRLKRDIEQINAQAQQLEASQASGGNLYLMKEQQELSALVQARQQGADAFMAEIDARKEKAIQDFKTLIESGDLASQYFFRVRGEQARVQSMVLLIGDKKAAVEAGDERLTLMRYMKRDADTEKAWWAQKLAAYVSAEGVRGCAYIGGCRNPDEKPTYR